MFKRLIVMSLICSVSLFLFTRSSFAEAIEPFSKALICSTLFPNEVKLSCYDELWPHFFDKPWLYLFTQTSNPPSKWWAQCVAELRWKDEERLNCYVSSASMETFLKTFSQTPQQSLDNLK